MHRDTSAQVCVCRSSRHTFAHRRTFDHQSAPRCGARNCPDLGRNGTETRGCFREIRPEAAGEESGGRVSTARRTGLGTGGITIRRELHSRCIGTATYRCVGVCLSLRRGAAGSEWALAPGACSLALGRELGQRPRSEIDTSHEEHARLRMRWAARLNSKRSLAITWQGETRPPGVSLWGASESGKRRTRPEVGPRPIMEPGWGGVG